MEPKKKPSTKGKSPNRYLQFTSIAFQMAAAVVIGNYVGTWLDEKYNTHYWASTLTLLAVFAAMYLVISQVIKLSKDDD